jgi:hypothetical protein
MDWLPSRVRHLATTEIEDECSFDGCDRPTDGAAAYNSSEHPDVVVVWLCEVHGKSFETPPDAITDVLVQETSPTCSEETEGRICGKYATHALVVGGEYDDDRPPEIRIISVCGEHAY